MTPLLNLKMRHGNFTIHFEEWDFLEKKVLLQKFLKGLILERKNPKDFLIKK